MKTVGDRIQACSVTGVKPGFNEHGNETVRDALDMVHGDLAAQDRAWLGRLHGEQAHVRVDRAECLADADQGAAAADAKHQRVGQLPLWQLGEDFRARTRRFSSTFHSESNWPGRKTPVARPIAWPAPAPR